MRRRRRIKKECGLLGRQDPKIALRRDISFIKIECPCMRTCVCAEMNYEHACARVSNSIERSR